MKELVLVGAGGFAKSVLDSIDFYNYKMIGFLDDYKSNKEHLGYPIIGSKISDIENPQDKVFFVCIGDNKKRKEWYDLLIENNLSVINVIDSSAIVSNNAFIGNGNFVGKMAIINSHAVVGDNCIINTKALIEHGCHIKNYVNISTNTVLNGDVVCEEGSFIGSCSVISGQKCIGSWATVGAGSVVVRDVDNEITVVGCPAYNIIERKIENEKN